MGFSDDTIVPRTTLMVIILSTLVTVNAVRVETPCTNDRDCWPSQWCYNVSSICVDFNPCHRYNRIEGPTPARQASHCGPCSPGFAEELLGTGVLASSCKRIMVSKETQTDPLSDPTWSWLWIGLGTLFGLIVLALLIIILRRCIRGRTDDTFFKKKIPRCSSPTAPPQDDATFRLRTDRYLSDEEQPPTYSVIGLNVDKTNLVNTAPTQPPNWVTKPSYDPDYNDNIADGVAIPIHSSSTNLQMDVEDEEETTPSPWMPEQLTVNLPSRPFARFAIEQQENVLNHVLLRGNYVSNSNYEGSSSDDGADGLPEQPSGSRSHGDTFCGPNVQINQTITLNIAKDGMK